MINTAKDFSAAIRFLQKNNLDFPNIPNENMSSYEFNKAMNSFERHLNRLYEKIRILEDVKNYTKTYVMKTINEKEQAFQKKLKNIEEIGDQYRDNAFIAYAVPIEHSDEAIYDRDGSSVEKMRIVNENLEHAVLKSKAAKISTIKRTSDTLCYNNSYDNLINNIAGRSYYLSDNPIYGGVKEEVAIDFPDDTECDLINIIPSNCEIENIRIINKDNGETPVGSINESFPAKTAKGVRFTATCRHYAYEIVDEQAVASVQADTYNEKQIMKDIVEVTEQKTAQKEINKFQRDYEKWQEQDKQTTARNIAVEEAK